MVTPDHEELLKRATHLEWMLRRWCSSATLSASSADLIRDLAAALRDSIAFADELHACNAGLGETIDSERAAHEATKQRFSAHLHEPHPTIYPLTTDGAGFVAALTADLEKARAELAEANHWRERHCRESAQNWIAWQSTKFRLASAEAALQYEAGCDACPLQRPCTSCGGTRLAPVARAHFAKFKDPT